MAYSSSSSFLSPTLPLRTTALPPKLRHHFRPTMSASNQPNNNNNPITTTITTLTNLLWGKSLPPQLLISTVRTTWSSLWLLMMSQLAPSDPASGTYSRPSSQFRATPPYDQQLTRQKPNTLHLYVGLPCPWAHRTLIVRALKNLENSVPISVASPGIDGSWVFQEHSPIRNSDSLVLVPTLDKANGAKILRGVYKLRQGGYDGRCTVPMLWDVEKKEVVCNESYDIIELLNSGLNHLAGNPDLDLSPLSLKKEIDEWNRVIYPNINNGVYRCGFAQTQEAYDTAVNELFSTLDIVDNHLGGSRYLCGDTLTLADVCLFTTLIRFDLVYNVMFKCTKKKLIEYPNLHGYMREIYQIPKVAETCNLGAIMDGYYKFLFPLNPGNIKPIMPAGCEHEVLSESHNREFVSPAGKSVEMCIS